MPPKDQSGVDQGRTWLAGTGGQVGSDLRSSPGLLTRRWPIVLAALVGAAVVLYQTRYGPGASGDSSSYLMGAQNFLAGHGFYRFSGGYELKPITGFPPLFSLVLAGVGAFIGDLYAASRWLNALLFGASLLLAGLLVERHTRSVAAATVGTVLLLSTDTLVNLYSWVMSEPLYVFLSLLFLLFIVEYLDHPTWYSLVLGGLAAAAAILTRYAGLSLVAVGAAGIAVLGPSRIRRRVTDAVVLVGVSCLPFILWTQRNAVLAGTRVDRQLAYHPMDLGLIKLFLANVSSWFVPNDVPFPSGIRAALAMAIAVGICGLFVWVSVRSRLKWSRRTWQLVSAVKIETWTLPWLIMVYAAAYALVLFVNSTFLDASTTVTAPERYLAPLYVTVVVLMVSVGHDLLTWTDAGRWWRGGTLALVTLVFAFNAWNALSLLSDPLPNLGYTARRILWSPTMDALRKAEASEPVISNNPEMVYILTGEPAYVRPILYDQYHQQARQDYETQMAVAKHIMSQGAVFVVFDAVEQEDTNLIQEAGLTLALRTPHAFFYVEPGNPFLERSSGGS